MRRPSLFAGPIGRLAAALFLFGFGQELWFRYLPTYLRALGGSALIVGLFGTVKDSLDAAYAYPGGVLSDRLGPRRALLLFGLLATAGLCVYLFWTTPAGVFAGLLIVMAWPSLGLPATFAMVGDELPDGRRVAGFTVQAVVKRVPIVLAPPLGGFLLEKMGARDGMRAGFAASIVLSVGALLLLRHSFRAAIPRQRPREREKPAPSRPLPHALRRLLVADCLVRLCEGLPAVFLVLWAIERVGVSPTQFGILISVMTVAAIASYLPGTVFAERTGKKFFVLLTYLFFALFPLAVLFSRSFAHLAGAYVLGGLREIGEPARKALIVDLADSRSVGRTVGLYYAIRGFAVAGASAVGGFLWTIEPSWTFLAAAGLGFLGTVWAALFLPRTAGSSDTARS